MRKQLMRYSSLNMRKSWAKDRTLPKSCLYGRFFVPIFSSAIVALEGLVSNLFYLKLLRYYFVFPAKQRLPVLYAYVSLRFVSFLQMKLKKPNVEFFAFSCTTLRFVTFRHVQIRKRPKPAELTLFLPFQSIMKTFTQLITQKFKI